MIFIALTSTKLILRRPKNTLLPHQNYEKICLLCHNLNLQLAFKDNLNQNIRISLFFALKLLLIG